MVLKSTICHTSGTCISLTMTYTEPGSFLRLGSHQDLEIRRTVAYALCYSAAPQFLLVSTF